MTDTTYHNIYILDQPVFKINNINFLSYLKRNLNIIKKMNVKINITSLTLDQLESSSVKNFLANKQIDTFPILITENKVYKGLQEILFIYESNIKEYMAFMSKQVQPSKQDTPKKKEPPSDDSDEEGVHSYMSKELHIKNTNDENDEETPFGDVGDNSMMDTYRHIMNRRNKKDMFSSKTRTLENTNSVQNEIYNQLQNNKSNQKEREDNIKTAIDDDINIDPSTVQYDPDEEDPNDILIEKAYWSRMAETK